MWKHRKRKKHRKIYQEHLYRKLEGLLIFSANHPKSLKIHPKELKTTLEKKHGTFSQDYRFFFFTQIFPNPYNSKIVFENSPEANISLVHYFNFLFKSGSNVAINNNLTHYISFGFLVFSLLTYNLFIALAILVFLHAKIDN